MDLNQLFQSPIFGNVLNIVSIVLAAVGFSITIWQTVRSRREAREARDVAMQVRDDLRKVDTIADLSRAIQLIEHIKALQREEAWRVVPDKYSSLRELLIAVREAESTRSPENQASLQGAITQVAGLEKSIETFLAGNHEKPSFAKFNQVVSKQAEKLMVISAEIRNRTGVQRAEK